MPGGIAPYEGENLCLLGGGSSVIAAMHTLVVAAVGVESIAVGPGRQAQQVESRGGKEE